jgi:hypothetical protein
MKTGLDIATQREEGSAKSGAKPLPALFLPEGEPSEWVISVALFAVRTAYLLLFRQYGAFPGTRTTLQGAQRILKVQRMYCDFFCSCISGCYYFLGLLFKGLGDSIIVAREGPSKSGGFPPKLIYYSNGTPARIAQSRLGAS